MATVRERDVGIAADVDRSGRTPLDLHTEGGVDEWFRALWEKKAFADAQDSRAKGIYLELDLAGGGMQGVLHVGLLKAMQERGLLEQVDKIVGVSTGALAAVVAIGMNNPKAIDAYLDVAMYGIVNPRRLLIQNIVDLDKLETHLGALIDPEKIKNATTQLSCMVTNAATGQPVEVDITRCKDPLGAAIASAAIPGITKSPYSITTVDGNFHAVDGIVSCPYPTTSMNKFTTHRLMAVPYKPGGGTPWYERAVMASGVRLPFVSRRAIWNMNKVAVNNLTALRAAIHANPTTVGMVYPQQSIPSLSQDWVNHLRPYQAVAQGAFGIVIDKAREQSQL